MSRLSYPANLRTVLVNCSGTVDVSLIMDAFAKGADGVFIGACKLGDCHYTNGNYHAKKRVSAAKMLMREAGLEPERLTLRHFTSADAQLFADAATDFSAEVKGLGPLLHEASEKEVKQ